MSVAEETTGRLTIFHHDSAALGFIAPFVWAKKNAFQLLFWSNIVELPRCAPMGIESGTFDFPDEHVNHCAINPIQCCSHFPVDKRNAQLKLRSHLPYNSSVPAFVR
ncbi:unnamed protein product [Hymenolepis diminuta]|uniref:Uncharacterized protein n=1 Tax=Hymenolepis diminuta TaxID=6216 RepID=A0A564Z2U2_HYMDI|nr:unnamed protein product [Hymenolepis diminuta]